MTITGELREWQADHSFPKHVIYWGRVFGDVKGRFKDGSRIHTSYVKHVEDCGDHLILTTRNSVYKLMKDQAYVHPREVVHFGHSLLSR